MPRFKNWQLLAICVLTWGTTWYVITLQLEHAAPEVGVALRFGLAGGAVLAWCALRGHRLRYAPAQHAWLALQGSFLYGVSYVCVYHAETHVASGLVAVGYSASPLVSGLGAHLLFGLPLSRRFVAGGVLGVLGVALIFWPELGRSAGAANAALGAVLTLASVLLSTVGSLSASRNRQHGLPLWPALGYGMLYGALAGVVMAVASGDDLAPPAALAWWLALLYLALAGSILTFACFLTLQERIGPGPTGTVGVMTPLLALALSVAFEGLRPALLTLAGAGLAMLGNALMLLPARPRAATPASAA
jgi:drug/metabolite transporter (DMT)-like permease